MTDNKFFEELQDQSEVKARTVTKYFRAWSRIVMPSVERFDRRLAYIDLYAGPGRYEGWLGFDATDDPANSYR